jgi:SAM-dependent methyltransferase
MSQPTVCYLLESTGQWGGVKIVFEQAEQLSARGFDVVIAAKDSPPAWWDLKVPLVTVPDFGGRHLPEADVYVGTSWTTVPGAHDSGLGIGAHLVQGYEGDFAEYAPIRDRIDFVYSLKTVKVAVAPHIQRRVQDRFAQPCRLIRNGIDTSLFHAEGRQEDRGVPRIVVPGPFEIPLKGLRTVLGALARLRREGHAFELVRISQTPISAAERALCAADEEHVAIRAEEVAEVLRGADLVVSNSAPVEGFGLPAIEAMACGCAAVLSDIPAYRGYGEAVGGWDREYARFAGHDDAGSFAAAIAGLLGDGEARRALAASATELAARYSWDEVGPELADAFRALIDDERERWIVRAERMVPGESDALTEGMHVQRYEHLRQFAPGARVVDAGTGAGYGSFMMAESGAVSVRALDYCETTLKYAEERYGHEAITWEHADLRDFDWEERSADLITCFEVFEHVVDPSSLVAGFGRALADEGQLWVSTPTACGRSTSPPTSTTSASTTSRSSRDPRRLVRRRADPGPAGRRRAHGHGAAGADGGHLLPRHVRRPAPARADRPLRGRGRAGLEVAGQRLARAPRRLVRGVLAGGPGHARADHPRPGRRRRAAARGAGRAGPRPRADPRRRADRRDRRAPLGGRPAARRRGVRAARARAPAAAAAGRLVRRPVLETLSADELRERAAAFSALPGAA